MFLTRFAVVALLCLSAVPAAWAQADATFNVKLGKTTLGTLAYARGAKGETLNSALSSTPMGVFNGTFLGTSAGDASARTFEGISTSSRKTRNVLVTFAAGRAVETAITPVSEMTPLSDPARAPAGTLDPVQAIGALIAAPACPDKITIYDGRRAIALLPGEATIKDDVQTCQMSYRVVAGPGHLSPLKISKAKMALTYVTGDAARRLTQINISSGIFKLVLKRAE